MITFPVLVINLPERTDRWDRFRESLRRSTPPFIDSIHRIEAIADKDRPERGCELSHLKAIEYAITHKFEKVMICEDDCYFTTAYTTGVLDELPDDWELVSGGASGLNLTKKFISRDQLMPEDYAYVTDHLVRKITPYSYITGFHCTLYRDTILEKVCDIIKNDILTREMIHVDVLVSSKIHAHYICVPFIAYTLFNDQSSIRTDEDTTDDLHACIIPTQNVLFHAIHRVTMKQFEECHQYDNRLIRTLLFPGDRYKYTEQLFFTFSRSKDYQSIRILLLNSLLPISKKNMRKLVPYTHRYMSKYYDENTLKFSIIKNKLLYQLTQYEDIKKIREIFNKHGSIKVNIYHIKSGILIEFSKR